MSEPRFDPRDTPQPITGAVQSLETVEFRVTRDDLAALAEDRFAHIEGLSKAAASTVRSDGNLSIEDARQVFRPPR